MSNKRIDLTRKRDSYLPREYDYEIGEHYIEIENLSRTIRSYDALALCDFDDMLDLPEFAMLCIKSGVKPLCGVSFVLETPEACLTDSVQINCYAEDEEGCNELQFLYGRSDEGMIKYKDFCKFSNHLQVGLDIIFCEVDMIIIKNIFETVFIPDFVLIDSHQCYYRSWESCRIALEGKGVLICGSNFPKSPNLTDAEILEDYKFIGDKAYEYVIENPRKIADRISGNYKFNIPLIGELEEIKNNPFELQVY